MERVGRKENNTSECLAITTGMVALWLSQSVAISFAVTVAMSIAARKIDARRTGKALSLVAVIGGIAVIYIAESQLGNITK